MNATAVRWNVSGVSSFDFLSEEYRTLFATSDATPFQSPLWLDRIYAGLASEHGARPLIITIRDAADQRLVALIPLAVDRYFGVSIAGFADYGVSDYCTIVGAAEDLSSLRGNKTLASQIRQAFGKCDLLIVRKVPEQALDAFDMVGAVKRRRVALGAHATALSHTFEDWRRRAMPEWQRRSLDKKRRSIARKGSFKTEAIEGPEGLVAALGQIRELRKSRFSENDRRNLLSEESYFRFYCEVASDPMCRAYVMTLDDKPISVAFGTTRRGRFHLILTGFDFVNYRNHSLGLLVIEDAIKDCISRGEEEFDLTIGDQPYKRNFGTVETPMWWVWCGLSTLGYALSIVLSRSPPMLALVRPLVR